MGRVSYVKDKHHLFTEATGVRSMFPCFTAGAHLYVTCRHTTFRVFRYLQSTSEPGLKVFTQI